MKTESNTIAAIYRKIDECYDKACEHQLLYENIHVSFNLKGACAGKFVVKNGIPELRFNLQLAIDNEEEFLNQTVPHEIAHYLVWKNYPNHKGSHGVKWKLTMWNVFDLEPKRCHKYVVSNVKRIQNRKEFVYKCACSEHTVGLNRHNKIQKMGVGYRCVKCKSKIEYSN